MAVTNAQANLKPEPRKAGKKATTLDDDLDKPQVTEPGDAPFDTLDPEERASSSTPDKGAAARAGFGVVNAVVSLPPVETPKAERGEDRIERYEVTGPDGKLVSVTHNLDTGETSRS
jgi:hypothetical protein